MNNLVSALPADHEARAAALNITHSFAVSAPAGSGKTGLLTLRVLKLLAHCEKPEEILCITFTRKAANEMRERIFNALELAMHCDVLPDDPHQQQLITLAKAALENNNRKRWNLQQLPYRLQIQTIDGFCKSLTNQMPIVTGIGTNTGIEEDLSSVYRRAVESFLDDFYGGSHTAPMRVLLKHFDNNLENLASLLTELLASRDQWIDFALATRNNTDAAREFLENAIRNWANDIVAGLADVLGVYAGELCELFHFSRQNLTDEAFEEFYSLPGASEHAIRHFWQPLARLCLTKGDTWRKQLNKNDGFPPGKNAAEKKAFKHQKERMLQLIADMMHTEGLQDLLAVIGRFPPHRFDEPQWKVTQALVEILPIIVAHLRLVFAREGKTDYTEVTLAAIQSLGNDESVTDLALKLDYQLKHILVDEFQDTSSSQLQLLEKLTAGWEASESRTLFVVGDGMQSCYGFRNANVGIFLNLRKNGLQNVLVRPLDLTVNFRSRQEIVNWVNTTFSCAFPSSDDIGRGAVSFRPAVAHHPASDSGHSPVECIGFIDDKNREQEAAYVIRSINEIRQHYPDESIAILVRSRSHLADMTAALTGHSIDYEAVEIDRLSSRMIITDLLSLTRALLNPADRIAWLAILRAPWCGLDLHDLYAVVNDGYEAKKNSYHPPIPFQLARHETIAGLSEGGRQRLARCAGAILTCREQTRRKPLAAAIKSAWLAIGGAEYLRHPSEIDDVEVFFNLLAKHESQGTIEDWQKLYTALDKLYAQPTPRGNNPVQLITMHKAKGLEFDTVFVIGLDRQNRADSSPILYWHERINQQQETDLIISPISSFESEEKDPLFNFLRDEKKIKNRLEDTRLLYVACTRARKRLRLTASLSTAADGTIKEPVSNCMLARIWEQVKEPFIASCAGYQPVPVADIEDDAVARKRLRLIEEWAPPRFSRGKTGTAMLPEFDNTGADLYGDLRNENYFERCTGTLLHRILRRITLDGIDHWNEEKIQSMQKHWRAQLFQAGLDDENRNTGLQKINSCLLRLRTSKQARWILDHSHEDSQCELNIIYGPRSRVNVVDRTFIENGIRWVIDYKSSTPAAGEAMENFLLRQRSAHASQLNHYAQLFRQMDDNTQQINQALYFPYLDSLYVIT